ncbi:MAG: CoA ester lyase [Tenericutes bacterium HGW-Tenericutes-3]|nr:MAG: CoA ester lyase [Tenericutes bacterium HGW-Tenericutes-3]
MRRSLLFIPANSPAMLQNADIFAADGVIFDLEDAVVVSEKDAALSLLNQYLSSFKLNNLEVIIRINSLNSSFSLEELDLLINDRIDTIMLPKATYEDTMAFSKLIDKVSIIKKLTKNIQIIPIIESAKAVIEVNQIASVPRVSGLLLGGEDLATDLEVERSESSIELLLSRSMVVLAAKANGIDAIDTPFTNTQDENGLLSDSNYAKRLGMNAKVSIHPNQIDIINSVFSPSQTEIDHAKKIIAVMNQKEENQKGAFSMDGQMIDKPIIERAQKLLAKAEKWKLL